VNCHPGATFVSTAQRCGGAQFFHRYNRHAEWEPYTEDQNAMILRAMTPSPAKGAMPLQLGPAQFEIRWGMGGEFGIQQVNLRSGNTRDCKAEVRGKPSGPSRSPSFVESGFADRKEYEAALAEGLVGALDLSEGGEGGFTVAHAHWWWQEDAHKISRHSAEDVRQPGNWVRYAGSVCAELDDKWHAYVVAGKPESLQVVGVDLEARIGSTGTESKVDNNHTGVFFNIDFEAMEQKNAKSGFARKIEREEFQPSKPIPRAPPPPAAVLNTTTTTVTNVTNVTVVQAPPRMPMAIPVDTTGDGVANAVGYDIDGDGRVDIVGAPVNPMMPPPGGGMMPPPGGGMPPPGAPQVMRCVVPDGVQGGTTMQVNTPRGVMNVQVPEGLAPGAEFEFRIA